MKNRIQDDQELMKEGGDTYLVALFLVRDPNFVAFGQAELGLLSHDSLGKEGGISHVTVIMIIFF